MFLILAVILPLCVSGQPEPSDADLRTIAQRMFLKADSSGDGVIRMSEVETDFLACDKNQDGRVSRHEYEACSFGNDTSLEDMAHAFYDIIDFNDDQHLEMDDFAHIFQVLDADRNAEVTDTEFVAYWLEILRQLKVPVHIIG